MSNAMIMPAGKYWIGDPCYIFPHKGPFENKWTELLERVSFFSLPYGELDDGKIKVWAKPTAYGDGQFISSNDEMFCVDSGLIGIVPQETVDYLNRTDNDLNYLGLFVEFEEPFVVMSVNGNFSFGSIRINTSSEEDYIDDYADDSQYEDENEDNE